MSQMFVDSYYGERSQFAATNEQFWRHYYRHGPQAQPETHTRSRAPEMHEANGFESLTLCKPTSVMISILLTRYACR